MTNESPSEWEQNLARYRLKLEIGLATRLRQCFRAVEARDGLAVQDEIPLIIRCLYLFLEVLLDPKDSWESQGRWFDDMIFSQYQIHPGRFVIAGRLVWGLSSDTGPQWSAPFSAEVTLRAGLCETESYLIRFGRRGDPDGSTPVQFGFYSDPDGPSESIDDPWHGKADWLYEFRKDAPNPPSAPTPPPPEAAGPG